ncbi:MAG: GNAT family N-acetyltransferase [Flavobacterium sp.]|nr:GNAT family N-acetyltransferase [Pedobacter sp.]
MSTLNLSESPKFTIRGFKKGDEASLQKYADNQKVSVNLRNSFPYPFTLEHAASWIEMNTKSYQKPTNMAITLNNEVIGSIGITLQTDIFKKSAELGYWLGEPFWNQGITTKAVREMIKYVFDNFKLVRIYAGVFEYNIASMKVLEKAGFHKEAVHRNAMFKKGKVFDEHLFVIFKSNGGSITSL